MTRIKPIHILMLPLTLVACFVASCSREDTGTALESAEPDTAASSESMAAPDLLPHQQMAKDFLRELI